MLKVLIGHNHYRSSSPSGEDSVYQNERRLLQEAGMDVIPYERFNDDIDESTFRKRCELALSGVWSKETYEDIRRIIRDSRPDIAHFHNIFPLISPSAYTACKDAGVPVVQTLHNYRLICPGALLMRDGRVCEDCVGSSFLPALRHRCYRDSFAATSAVVLMLMKNRKTYRHLIDRYIALTDFAAGRFIKAGLPGDRIIVKPNFLFDVPAPGVDERTYALYVGRLSDEKGIQTLLDSWKKVDKLNLKIIGDGPLKTEVERAAMASGERVEFLGPKKKHEIFDFSQAAVFQLIPSECYEGFPMVLLEAYACATPIIASRIGSLRELVDDGMTGHLFEPGNADDLAAKVNGLSADPGIGEFSRNARSAFDRHYTAERNLALLSEIYESLL